jgi:hypothetical protein
MEVGFPDNEAEPSKKETTNWSIDSSTEGKEITFLSSDAGTINTSVDARGSKRCYDGYLTIMCPVW